MSSELCFMSASVLAHEIRARRLSATEVMDAHIAQIERLNPALNAIVTFLPERGREHARAVDAALARGADPGPLAGLPVAHKDLVPTRGVRTTFGSRIYRDFVPDADAILVERLREAGAIMIGKTNTPEFGAGSQTFNEVFGVTRNPYDLTKTCGGSSGGAAVSLACGMLPTAACGNAWSTISVNGPLARSVSDLALVLSAIAGPDARCPISITEPGAP